ncbi:MAG: TonB-dependent receptor [Pseudomonadota bacterium]
MAQETSTNAQEAQEVVLDTVVITATPLERTTDELAAPVTIIERDEIARSGAATLGDLLKYKPGVTESSFAPGSSRPIIRGLDNFRIRIQENGIGSQDVSALSEDHAIPFDPFTTQRVEVIRGPATLRYGSEAIGGVVSVLNNRIPQYAPEGGFSGEVFSSIETVDEGLDVGALADFAIGRVAGHIDGFMRERENYDTPDGEQENSFVEAEGAAAGGSVLLDNGFLGASVQLYQSEYGLPGGEAAENEIFIDLRQVKVNAAGEINNLGGFIDTIRGQVGYADYEHDEVEGTTGEVKSTYNNDSVEGRIEVVHAPIGGVVEGAFGFQASHRDLSAAGEGGELIAPATADRFALFLFEEVSVLDRAVLQLGGRVEHVKLDGFGVEVAELAPATNGGPGEIDDLGSDRKRDFTPLSASAALVVDVAEATTLGFTVQYAERAPSLLELFAKGPHEATETFEIGDPRLDKEKALSFELTAKRVAGPFQFEASAFHTSYQDFIFKRFTGNSCGEEFDTCEVGDGEELTQITYSAADATFIGAELGASWDAIAIGDGVLGFDGQFDIVRAEFDSGGDVPRIPPMRLGAGVYYQQGGFSSRVGVLRAFEQDDVAENEEPTKGFTDLTAEASYSFAGAEGQPGFEIGVVGSNLLDDEIRNHSSFKKDDVLLPGASARVFGRVTF